MADEAEVTAIAALAEGPGADEIDVVQVAVVALVLVTAFLLDERGHPCERVFLLLSRQFPEQDGGKGYAVHGFQIVGQVHGKG